MEISGRVMQLMPVQSGQGKSGIWRKMEFVIEVPGQVTRKVCFSLWGDKIDQAGLVEGDEVDISFDLESREYNNRWYTEARAWKVVRRAGRGPAAEEPPPGPEYEAPGEDALPF